MKLKKILEGVELKKGMAADDIEVAGLSSDSKTLKVGDLFIAFRGYAEDGYKYIDDAIAKGASIVVAEKDFDAPPPVKKILVKDTRLALPLIAANFYGNPSKRMTVIGVTGTNGKTTITYLLESILRAAGEDAGVIGTINYRFRGRATPAKNTTPGPIELQSILSRMARAGLRYAVMEVSSHSLDQRRVDGAWLDAAVFSNITSEHLDYHKTMKEYLAAKAKIFSMAKEGASAILNNDDPGVASLAGSIVGKIVSYGIEKDAVVRGRDIELSIDGSRFVIAAPKEKIEINTKLIGLHNVSNILAAASAALALGIKADAIKRGVEALYRVPGRLDPVDAGQQFRVYVDYAHTEDALNNILTLLRGVARKRIITLFGCGGSRDKTKRPLMGKAACKFSDRVIITSDNPRFEDPLDIIGQIEAGIKGSFSNYDIVPDRRGAIGKALNLAEAGDIVVIAGKGHEDYQIVRDKALPFDDREVVKEMLAAGITR